MDFGQPLEAEQDVKAFLRSWAWKREHRPDKARFKLPYLHKLSINATQQEVQLTIRQAKFVEEGFASTVWDSSIVMAKYVERWQDGMPGKRCLDLSAGCGLVGIVAASLGAEVVATDLSPNLPLLQQNCTLNKVNVKVVEHAWGRAVPNIEADFDYIFGCDLLYIEGAIDALIRSLQQLSSAKTQVLLATGRNRQAESIFLSRASQCFDIEQILKSDLDEVYQCSDVSVLRLTWQ